MMMLIKTPQGRLLIDSKAKAMKGMCKGQAGFKAQINALKEVIQDGGK